MKTNILKCCSFPLKKIITVLNKVTAKSTEDSKNEISRDHYYPQNWQNFNENYSIIYFFVNMSWIEVIKQKHCSYGFQWQIYFSEWIKLQWLQHTIALEWQLNAWWPTIYLGIWQSVHILSCSSILSVITYRSTDKTS